jgi:CTP:phosphocholine cytidylyltransferase-like protein
MINSFFLIISLLLSIVVIWSNLDVLPHISRGAKVSLEQTLWTPTTPQCYMSVFLPLPVHKSNFFNTDISMRNIYIGVAHFAGIILLVRFLTRRMFISLAIPLAFFVLLSAGGYFKTLAWKALPLTGFVRLNGEFTYFVILILLLSGAAGIQNLIKAKTSALPIGKFLFWVCCAIAAFSIILILSSKSSFLFHSIPKSSSLKNILKSFVDNTSFWDLFFIQATIQAATIFLTQKFLVNKSTVLGLLCINLIITTWLTLPFTGLGTKSKKEIQSVIDTFPRGITPQPLVSVNEASYIKPDDEMQFMLISSYSKRIGYTKPDLYPIQLNKNISFYNDTSLYSFIKKQSFLFLSTDTAINTATNFDSAHILVLRSGPGYTKCIIKNNNYNWITLLQNNYKYWQVKIDGKTTQSLTGFKTFITVPIKPGQHIVEFEFDPQPLKTALWINLFLFLVVAIILCIPKLSEYKVFRSSSLS